MYQDVKSIYLAKPWFSFGQREQSTSGRHPGVLSCYFHQGVSHIYFSVAARPKQSHPRLKKSRSGPTFIAATTWQRRQYQQPRRRHHQFQKLPASPCNSLYSCALLVGSIPSNSKS